ncbi:MAG: hypothetical protein OFPII_31440 [Osedax symbiont Rs1]|nr:MAG: hypothetical protein OFPII_31440 [Osedax symbiont Rs1]
MTSLHYIAQALDFTAVRKIATEPMGAVNIFQFHCKTNILHSVSTLKSRIQDLIRDFMVVQRKFWLCFSSFLLVSLKIVGAVIKSKAARVVGSN